MFFFFFKQKTAYEMRISDWSSDVCSSDLRADDLAFADRSKDDRHHFRFIVSPEDAGEMTDLRAFTRDLATQMEADLGSRLDWVAVDHWNTDNPHVHLLVRGVADTGADLVISSDYISRGLRSTAAELDRKSVVWGQMVSVGDKCGGRRLIKK